jgi:rhodanese-related sulfurtransferase
MVYPISPQELREKLDSDAELLLLDVREPDEYEEFNLGGTLVSLGEFLSRLGEFEDWKNREVVVHCNSGKRSEAACAVMDQLGFTKISNLQGGVKAWLEVFES